MNTKNLESTIVFEVPQDLSRAFELLSDLPDDFYAEPRVDSPSQEREQI